MVIAIVAYSFWTVGVSGGRQRIRDANGPHLVRHSVFLNALCRINVLHLRFAQDTARLDGNRAGVQVVTQLFGLTVLSDRCAAEPDSNHASKAVVRKSLNEHEQGSCSVWDILTLRLAVL